MVTESAHLQIVLEARDRARAELQKTEAELRKLGLTARQTGAQMSGASGVMARWTGNMRSSLLSMVSLSSILGVAGLSVGSLTFAMHGLLQRQQEAARAAQQMNTRLVLMGLSASSAAATVDELRGAVNAATFTSLRGMSAEMIDFAAVHGPDFTARLADAAEKLGEMTGIPIERWLETMRQGALGNIQPLNDLGVKGNDLAEALGNIDTQHKEFIRNMPELQRNTRELKSIWESIGGVVGRVAEEAGAAVTNLMLFGVAGGGALRPPPRKPPKGPPTTEPATDDDLPPPMSIQDILDAVNAHRGQIINNSDPSLGIGSQLTGMDAVNRMLQTMTPQAALAWARSWTPDSTVFMAQGGIVRRPTFAMLGEAGPEAVVPLRGGAAQQPIVIQIDGTPVYRGMLEWLDGQVRLREPSLGMG